MILRGTDDLVRVPQNNGASWMGVKQNGNGDIWWKLALMGAGAALVLWGR